MINWGFAARSSGCCSYRIQAVSQLPTAQGCSCRLAPGCSPTPRAVATGQHRRALRHCRQIRLPCPVLRGVPAGSRRVDQGPVGARPSPRGRWGDGIPSPRVLLGALLGKGHVPGPDAVWGTWSLDGDRAGERGNGWFAHGSRWLGAGERLFSPLAPSSCCRGSRTQAEARAGSGALRTFSTGERQSSGKRRQKRQQVLSCPRILGTWCSL